MFLNYRSNDAVITICQDNGQQEVRIHALNPPAEKILGYSSEEITGRILMEFLPERIRTLLEEYVEYGEGGNDVGNVLARVQSFCIMDRQGHEVAYRLKVLRSESLDSSNDYFRLILQDNSGKRQKEAFRAMLSENFKGHEVLDADTGLPDRHSLAKDIELVHFYVNKEAFPASFAMLEVDKFEEMELQHGRDACVAALRHITALARQNLRSDDTIGRAGEKHLGLILMDTDMESSRMVLNRLRWLVAATPLILSAKKTLPLTVSIAFTQVGVQPKETELIPLAEACLKVNQKPGGNALLDIPE